MLKSVSQLLCHFYFILYQLRIWIYFPSFSGLNIGIERYVLITSFLVWEYNCRLVVVMRKSRTLKRRKFDWKIIIASIDKCC
jgi:hypothetical protein